MEDEDEAEAADVTKPNRSVNASALPVEIEKPDPMEITETDINATNDPLARTVSIEIEEENGAGGDGGVCDVFFTGLESPMPLASPLLGLASPFGLETPMEMASPDGAVPSEGQELPDRSPPSVQNADALRKKDAAGQLTQRSSVGSTPKATITLVPFGGDGDDDSDAEDRAEWRRLLEVGWKKATNPAAGQLNRTPSFSRAPSFIVGENHHAGVASSGSTKNAVSDSPDLTTSDTAAVAASNVAITSEGGPMQEDQDDIQTEKMVEVDVDVDEDVEASGNGTTIEDDVVAARMAELQEEQDKILSAFRKQLDLLESNDSGALDIDNMQSSVESTVDAKDEPSKAAVNESPAPSPLRRLDSRPKVSGAPPPKSLTAEDSFLEADMVGEMDTHGMLKARFDKLLNGTPPVFLAVKSAPSKPPRSSQALMPTMAKAYQPAPKIAVIPARGQPLTRQDSSQLVRRNSEITRKDLRPPPTRTNSGSWFGGKGLRR